MRSTASSCCVSYFHYFSTTTSPIELEIGFRHSRRVFLQNNTNFILRVRLGDRKGNGQRLVIVDNEIGGKSHMSFPTTKGWKEKSKTEVVDDDVIYVFWQWWCAPSSEASLSSNCRRWRCYGHPCRPAPDDRDAWRNFSPSEIGDVFTCISTTIDPMDKQMVQADSTHQISLKPTLHAFLIIGCWCCTRGWRCVSHIIPTPKDISRRWLQSSNLSATSIKFWKIDCSLLQNYWVGL